MANNCAEILICLLNRLACFARLLELFEIGSPDLRLFASELLQIGPSVETGRMPVAKNYLGGIGSYGLNPGDADQALTENQLLLARPVAFHFSAGAFDAEQLGG